MVLLWSYPGKINKLAGYVVHHTAYMTIFMVKKEKVFTNSRIVRSCPEAKS